MRDELLDETLFFGLDHGAPGLPAENDGARQFLSGQSAVPVNVNAVECTALPNQLQFVKG